MTMLKLLHATTKMIAVTSEQRERGGEGRVERRRGRGREGRGKKRVRERGVRKK